MTCRECLDQHSEYLDGVLTDAVRERIEVHLARCPSCARYDRVVRRGLELVRAVPELDASPDFEQRLQHRIFHLRDDQAARRPRVSTTSGAALLAVAGLVSLVVWGPLAEPEVAAFESAPPTAMQLTSDDRPIGGSDAWYTGAPPVYMGPDGPPSLSLAFPGPYSPLIIEPPLRGPAGASFISLRLE